MKVRGTSLLVLSTVGARTGRERDVPLACFVTGTSRLVVVGAGGGAAQHPAWCLNLETNPECAHAQLPGRRVRVVPELLTGEEREAAWQRVIAAAPMYAKHQAKTDRQLPVIALVEVPA